MSEDGTEGTRERWWGVSTLQDWVASPAGNQQETQDKGQFIGEPGIMNIMSVSSQKDIPREK